MFRTNHQGHRRYFIVILTYFAEIMRNFGEKLSNFAVLL
jgi:hypothetical protein